MSRQPARTPRPLPAQLTHLLPRTLSMYDGARRFQKKSPWARWLWCDPKDTVHDLPRARTGRFGLRFVTWRGSWRDRGTDIQTEKSSKLNGSALENWYSTRRRLRRLRSRGGGCVLRRTRKVGCPSACQSIVKGAVRVCSSQAPQPAQALHTKMNMAANTLLLASRTPSWTCQGDVGHAHLIGGGEWRIGR